MDIDSGSFNFNPTKVAFTGILQVHNFKTLKILRLYEKYYKNIENNSLCILIYLLIVYN